MPVEEKTPIKTTHMDTCDGRVRRRHEAECVVIDDVNDGNQYIRLVLLNTRQKRWQPTCGRHLIMKEHNIMFSLRKVYEQYSLMDLYISWTGLHNQARSLTHILSRL